MSYIQYVKDRRYVLLLYAVMMLFVSLIMLAGSRSADTVGNIVYANVGCLFFAAIYMTIGYYYRRSFYRELSEFAGGGYEHWSSAGMPEPQTAEQGFYLNLLARLHAEHAQGTERLLGEIKDHRDFIVSWIHEVKQPIAASRLIMENRAGKTADDLADKLEDELDEIDGYVEQALYYSRLDSFSKDYFIAEVSLHSIVKESVKKAAKLFIHKRIRPGLDEVALSVHSDRKWLSYIVNQIVANSLAYTEAGGSIAFASEEDEREKRLLIRDTGIGIPAADLGRVFQKGFTGATGRSHTKSTGMGLYMAKQLAVKLGHDLSVRSTEGQGATVVIHFPKVRLYNDLR